MNRTNLQARIVTLATALNWAYHATDDPKIRRNLKQVIRWHMKMQAIEEGRAEASR